MNKPLIYSFIKTPCGRAKYNEIASRKNLISKIRLIFFILIATIKDWQIKDLD